LNSHIISSFTYYIHILYSHIIPKSRNSGLAVYVDDTAVFTSSWNTALLARRLQTYIDDILQFFMGWKMSINPDKSKVMIFTRRRYKSPPLIRLLNYSVPWTRKVLGNYPWLWPRLELGNSRSNLQNHGSF